MRISRSIRLIILINILCLIVFHPRVTAPNIEESPHIISIDFNKGINTKMGHPALFSSDFEFSDTFNINQETKVHLQSNDNNILESTDVNNNSFISSWDTKKLSLGSSTSRQIKLPLQFSGKYNFTVDWGDGLNNAITSWNQTEVTHTYASEGVYTITIDGLIRGWRFNNGGDKLKILTISQWGTLQLGNSGSYFYGSENIKITAVDPLNLTATTSLSRAFMSCVYMGGNGNINNWDVSNITDMSSLFSGAYFFNHSISTWNVSKVNNMNSMFSGAVHFNQPLDNWDVSNVIDMSSMFSGAYYFNQPISTWKLSKVIDMSSMFSEAVYFNQPIGNWDVSNVNDMSSMFSGAYFFNQPISTWNVSSVIDMSTMFSRARYFNQPIGSWDVSNVENMNSMLQQIFFDQPISTWNVSSVIDMGYMFSFTNNFNQPIGSWDVSNVENMGSMFDWASSFNQPLGNWNVSKVTNMYNMFNGVSSFNQPLGNWNVSEVTNMYNMFNDVTLSSQNYDSLLEGWAKLPLQNGVYFNAGNSNYSNITAREYIINSFGWTIKDGGMVSTSDPNTETQPVTGETQVHQVQVTTKSSPDNLDLTTLFLIVLIITGIGSIIYLITKHNKFDQSTIINNFTRNKRSVNTHNKYDDPSDYGKIPPDIISGGMILCGSCENVNPADSSFCFECGIKISN